MLFSGTSYELRNALTAVQGYLSLLLEPAADDMCVGQLRSCYRIMQHECDRAVHLMQDLLTFFALDQGGKVHVYPHPGRVDGLLARSVDHFRMASDRHRIELNVQPGLPPAYLDEERITQVVVSLISNAVKYSPHGGAIVVEAAARHDVLQIRVVDHGLGVAPADRDLIFAGFHRTHPEFPGNGIGLFVSRILVQAHGGAIGVAETPGGGATFWFELPVA